MLTLCRPHNQIFRNIALQNDMITLYAQAINIKNYSKSSVENVKIKWINNTALQGVKMLID